MALSKYLLFSVISISILAGFGLENAYAHSTKIAGDYKIEVGWIKEPALAGEPNAVEIVIQLATDYDKNKFDPATIQFLSQSIQEPSESDFSGIAESFDASLKFAGENTQLSFTEMEELPGVYYSPFTPEVTDIPNLQVYGTIKNIEFEANFKFEKVKEGEFDIEEYSLLPSWIKDRAGWWADDQIEDEDFVSGLQYLIKEGILQVPETEQGESSNSEIPDWVKAVARWWSQGIITDTNFVEAIQYLIKEGIIQV